MKGEVKPVVNESKRRGFHLVDNKGIRWYVRRREFVCTQKVHHPRAGPVETYKKI